MSDTGCELLAFLVSLVGWVCACAVTGMPQWKVTPFIGHTILNTEAVWEGIWMTCVYQEMTARMMCDVYDSLLDLPADLRWARALTATAIAVGLLGIVVTLLGMKCTTCGGGDRNVKGHAAALGGALFVMAGLCVLLPVSWAAHTVVVDFYSPLVPDSRKQELGRALYLGWTAAFLLGLGGAVLCCSCPAQLGWGDVGSARAARGSAPTKSQTASYSMREYV
ncbi:claudin-6-like [Callorhinchus milii]|uniref:claudin-6-like n=1 Tax=Callorhinchus milii TaxID=7868 RepID=UPI0004572E58|nr:claudin-6-like [Callorhinchus milii]|eukprot:gi/632954676/ref/XP_007893087.1/ PREDICTED: claudin-6-like [Callorhinchus milii]